MDSPDCFFVPPTRLFGEDKAEKACEGMRSQLDAYLATWFAKEGATWPFVVLSDIFIDEGETLCACLHVKGDQLRLPVKQIFNRTGQTRKGASSARNQNDR